MKLENAFFDRRILVIFLLGIASGFPKGMFVSTLSAWLTDEGLSRITGALPGHLAEVEQHFTGRFSADELARFVGWLRDIRDDVNPAARPSGEATGGSPAATTDQPAREPAGATPDGSGASTGRTGGRN